MCEDNFSELYVKKKLRSTLDNRKYTRPTSVHRLKINNKKLNRKNSLRLNYIIPFALYKRQVVVSDKKTLRTVSQLDPWAHQTTSINFKWTILESGSLQVIITQTKNIFTKNTTIR